MTPHKLLDQFRAMHRMIDGREVISESDVAQLYKVTVAQLRKTVKREHKRFPSELLLEKDDHFYFTETGVLMVSSVLRTKLAADISIQIIRELFSYPNN